MGAEGLGAHSQVVRDPVGLKYVGLERSPGAYAFLGLFIIPYLGLFLLPWLHRAMASGGPEPIDANVAVVL